MLLFVSTPFSNYLVFAYLIFRSFDARRECSIRKYSYLLPADVIGVKENFTSGEVDHHLSDFNDILNTFEVCLMQKSFSILQLFGFMLIGYI